MLFDPVVSMDKRALAVIFRELFGEYLH